MFETLQYDYCVLQLTDSLTTVKAVNKTDCMTLMSTFGVSLQDDSTHLKMGTLTCLQEFCIEKTQFWETKIQ